jgi:hypothetical protein
MKQKMRKLITTKPHKYGTRHLVAGDEYEVPERHAFALVAGKRARFAPDKPAAGMKPAMATSQPEPKPEPAAQPATPQSELAAINRLRVEATELGITIDGRWGLARLQYEIAQAKKKETPF